MTKKQFISILESRLAILPADERREFIQDMEAHFAFGLQNGRTEKEIAEELGDPFVIAREALGDLHPLQAPPANERNTVAKAFIATGLALFGLIAYPLLAALWITGGGVALSAAAAVISPALVVVDYILQDSFYPAKLFLSIALVGFSLFLWQASRLIFSALTKLTRGYSNWNTRVMKGRTHQ